MACSSCTSVTLSEAALRLFSCLKPDESPFSVTLVDDESAALVTTSLPLPLNISVDSGQIEWRDVVVLSMP
jgi:hypothetical protein